MQFSVRISFVYNTNAHIGLDPSRNCLNKQVEANCRKKLTHLEMPHHAHSFYSVEQVFMFLLKC